METSDRWIPPISPYCLLQEYLWPSEWRILVACMMLNCTSRKQVEKILNEFFRRWPGPGELIAADEHEVASCIQSLGFKDRRTKGLKKMSEAFLNGDWCKASELPGIGLYGSACHEILCRGNVPLEPPQDHALKDYVVWYNKHWRKHVDRQEERREEVA